MFAQILYHLSMTAQGNGRISIGAAGEAASSWATGALGMGLIGGHHRLTLPPARPVAITTVKARLVISTLKEAYCIVMALVRERPVGMALHELEEAGERIRRGMGGSGLSFTT